MTTKAKETPAAKPADPPSADPPVSGAPAKDTPPTTGTPADPAEAAADARSQAAAAWARQDGECVVDDGTAHTGRAVNGKVCSAHAMHYRADGTRR